MHYYRDSFTTFAEFKRESFHDREELGKDELELLHELDDEEALRSASTGPPSLLGLTLGR